MIQAGTVLQDIVHHIGVDVNFGVTPESTDKKAKNRLVGAFHGNPGVDTEKYYLSEFLKQTSRVRCMVCTVAFGLGVNIPDVRYVFNEN